MIFADGRQRGVSALRRERGSRTTEIVGACGE